MSENELSIERVFNTDALSLLNCGVREIDMLIHKKNGGLSSFVAEIPCECYLARVKDEPVAVFVFSNRFISIEEKRYPSLEIEFMAIKNSWRNMGIGSHILRLAEQNARAADFHFLTTAAFINKRYSAIGFYEKCGFEINGDKQANTVPMFKFLEEEQ